jgi:hypothetical protein
MNSSSQTENSVESLINKLDHTEGRISELKGKANDFEHSDKEKKIININRPLRYY